MGILAYDFTVINEKSKLVEQLNSSLSKVSIRIVTEYIDVD